MNLCIYHADCNDGFGSALAAKTAYPNIKLYPGYYQQDPPDVTGLDVLIVDFSYKRSVILEMASKANKIMIIDHHESAKDDLIDLPSNVTTVFDMNHSGCVLTWKTLVSDKVPKLLLYIEDRDLWKHALPFSREYHAYLSSFPMNISEWKSILNMLDRIGNDVSTECIVESIIDKGSAILRARNKDVDTIIKQSMIMIEYEGKMIPFINAPNHFTSDIASKLVDKYNFVAVYYISKGLINVGLRSGQNGANVKDIAISFGGGGHVHAAGFALHWDDFMTICRERNIFFPGYWKNNANV